MQLETDMDISPVPVSNGANGTGNAGADMLMRGHALQQMRTSFVTAVSVQKPRELSVVEHKFLEEARLAGEDFYYGWGVGRDRVEGPSKGLAHALARCWGNCAIEILPVQDLADSWIFTATFIDLETGFTLSRQFRQSKRWTVHGKLDGERKDDVRFQIGQSKAIRNVIINALPDWLINKAVDEAKKGVKDKLEKYIQAKGMPAAQDVIIRALEKLGVKEASVLAKFSVANRNALDINKLVILRGDLTAIENGQERAEDLFPKEPEKSPHVNGGVRGEDIAKAKEVPVVPVGDREDLMKRFTAQVARTGVNMQYVLDQEAVPVVAKLTDEQLLKWIEKLSIEPDAGSDEPPPQPAQEQPQPQPAKRRPAPTF